MLLIPPFIVLLTSLVFTLDTMYDSTNVVIKNGMYYCLLTTGPFKRLNWFRNKLNYWNYFMTFRSRINHFPLFFNRFSPLKNEYFKLGSFNIIYINWSKAGNKSSAVSKANVKPIGKYIAEFLVASKVDLKKIHVIGRIDENH